MERGLKIFGLIAAAALICVAMGRSAVAQDRMSMGGMNIVETAMGDARFSTLVKALQAAGLIDTLKGAGPFTVFAPTDEAFAKLPAGTVERLMQDPAKLRMVLMYHVVPGTLMSNKLMDDMYIYTASGMPFDVEVKNGMVMINNARIAMADVAASNGTIHAIDTVLMPAMGRSDGMSNAMSGGDMSMGQESMSMPPKMDIVEAAMSDPRFSMLVELVKMAGLVDTLKGAGPFTVFAPTNDAFARVPADKLNMLKNNPEMLREVLLYHVLNMRVPSSSARSMDAMTAQGANAKVKVKMDKGMTMVMVDKAKVIQADLMTSNGVIHAIDMVLIPRMMGGKKMGVMK